MPVIADLYTLHRPSTVIISTDPKFDLQQFGRLTETAVVGGFGLL